MLFALITLLVGLSISGVAGYFSVVGLGQLFAASFWSVVIMGTVIEAGKIMAATWLHANWKNPLVSWIHKMYLVIAIIVAMSITSLGIFGFLSKAHLDQEAPVIEQLTSQQAVETQIESLNADLSNLQKNLDSINNLSNKTNNNSLDAQRSRILRQMDKDRTQINQLNAQLLKDKAATSKVTLQLGPAKYLADILFGNGDQNIDKAVQIFIFLIMTVFDPLALILIISGVMTLRNLQPKVIPVVPVDFQPQPVAPVPVAAPVITKIETKEKGVSSIVSKLTQWSKP
jgi:hypothetical protein